MEATSKQPTLKPQDIVVAAKIAVNKYVRQTTLELANALKISASEVHSSIKRLKLSGIIVPEAKDLTIVQTAFHEFAVHGLKYTFPAIRGPIARGLKTGIHASQDFYQKFAESDELPLVWPDREGHDRGTVLIPLYRSVPFAARKDERLYRYLALADCIRAGSAREREFAVNELRKLV